MKPKSVYIVSEDLCFIGDQISWPERGNRYCGIAIRHGFEYIIYASLSVLRSHSTGTLKAMFQSHKFVEIKTL